MRVRYLGYTNDDGQRTAHGALDVGGEYVVLAITINKGFGHRFFVLDKFDSPSWFSVEHFDLVSDEVPSNWRIKVGDNVGSATSLRIAPESWLAPGFLEDFFGDGDTAALAAQSAFERELAVILRES